MMPLQSVHRCIVVATALGTLLCPQHATAQIISAPTRDVRSIPKPPIITAITQHDAQLHAPQYQSVFTIHGQHLTDIVSVSIGCCHVSGVNVGGRAEDTVAHVLYTTSKMSRTGEQVKITTAGGTEVLTFWPLLTVDSLRPRRTGASQTVTVYGRNLQNGDRMTFAGGLTATLVDHGGQLTVMVPPGARSGPITPPGYNTLILDSIEIATTVGRVKNPPTRIRPGGASSPVDASAEEGASRTETTSGSVANGSGTFRVDLPTGQVGGTQATFACQAVDGKIQLMITFGGDGGLMGVISGKVSNARPGTHEVFEDEDRGFSIGVTRMTMPMAAYPASAGSVTITEWTKAMIRGTFKYTGVSEDAEGVKHGHAVRGSFNATVALGC